MERLVVSKKRVADHGEVFTGKREVNAMLDLVKHETENLESRFLEPACGTGNFLTEVLERKLSIVQNRYRKIQLDYERNAVLAVSSVYGIDLLPDNVAECRRRLFEIFNQSYSDIYRRRAREECRDAVRYILHRNIICGDALTLLTGGDSPRPIVFSQWAFPFHDSRIKRHDWVFADLIPDERPKKKDLFSGPEQLSDIGGKPFLPTEIRSFPPIHFLRIGELHE